MPKQPARIDSLADAAAWIHEHDGRIEAWWVEQHRHNVDERTRTDDKFGRFRDEVRTMKLRITACERKLIYIAGVASWGGAVVGAIVGTWIKAAMGG